MRKPSLLVMIAPLMFCAWCAKSGGEGADTPIARKYARSTVPVYGDREFTRWLAALEKAEPVDLLAEEHYKTIEKQPRILSKIRLSSGVTGFIESAHLAGRVIVFTGDAVSAYRRPDTGAPLAARIPGGTIGFVVEEKADWVRVNTTGAGEKAGSEQWIRDGYGDDESLIRDAREREKARALSRQGKEPSLKTAR